MGLFFFNFHFLILLVRNCRIRNCQHFVSVHYLLPVVSVHFNMAYTRAMPFNYSFKKKIDMRSHVFVAGSFIWLIMLTCFLFEVTLSETDPEKFFQHKRSSQKHNTGHKRENWRRGIEFLPSVKYASWYYDSSKKHALDDWKKRNRWWLWIIFRAFSWPG